MADLQARAQAASAELARTTNPRTKLLRELSELNARWVARLVARRAGTDAYQEPEGGDPYVEALRQLLAGKGVGR